MISIVDDNYGAHGIRGRGTDVGFRAGRKGGGYWSKTRASSDAISSVQSAASIGISNQCTSEGDELDVSCCRRGRFTDLWYAHQKPNFSERRREGKRGYRIPVQPGERRGRGEAACGEGIYPIKDIRACFVDVRENSKRLLNDVEQCAGLDRSLLADRHREAVPVNLLDGLPSSEDLGEVSLEKGLSHQGCRGT